MTKFQTLTGLVVPQAPFVGLTDEDVALGQIPGWLMYMDPGVRVGADPTRIYNRIGNGKLLNAISGGSPIPIGTIGGQPSIAPSGTTAGTGVQFDQTPAIPADAWTFFSVGTLATGNNRQSVAVSKSAFLASEPDYSLGVGFTPNGQVARFWQRDQFADLNPRLSYTPASTFVGRRALVMWTFSTREGLAIWDNGVLGAASDTAAAKRPLSRGAGANEWWSLMRCIGNFGVVGALGIDLSWAENAGYRRRIEQFLMQKYSIA